MARAIDGDALLDEFKKEIAIAIYSRRLKRWENP